MESINRDTAFTPIFAPFSRSIGFAYWRIEDYARLRLCVYIYIYIERYHFVFFFFLKYSNILPMKYFSSLISIVSNFHPMINLVKEDGVLNIYVYIGNWFLKITRFKVFNSRHSNETRNLIGEYDRSVSFVLVIIKLSIFDISSSSDKFNDTRWIKVHGSVLNGASPLSSSHRAFERVNFQTDRSSSDP